MRLSDSIVSCLNNSLLDKCQSWDIIINNKNITVLFQSVTCKNLNQELIFNRFYKILNSAHQEGLLLFSFYRTNYYRSIFGIFVFPDLFKKLKTICVRKDDIH